MTDIIVMKTTGRNAPRVELGLPNPKNLIKGAYKTKTWNHDVGEDERLLPAFGNVRWARCPAPMRNGSSVTSLKAKPF